MNKPNIKEKPMFVRDGERFKLYLFKDSQKSPFFKNWIWKELAKEKGLIYEVIENDRIKLEEYRELYQNYERQEKTYTLLILQDTWQNYNEKFFMSVSGKPFIQFYSEGGGSGNGFESNRFKLISHDSSKFIRKEPCEMDLRVDKFSLYENQEENTCVLISGNSFLPGEIIKGDNAVEKALVSYPVSYIYLPRDLYYVCNYLGILGTKDRFIFFADLVKYETHGFIFNSSDGTYTELRDIQRKVYKDGGTTKIKFTLKGNEHEIHIDTPLKGDSRKALFDGVVPLEILGTGYEVLEELNHFSETTGIKLADPFKRRGLL